MDNRDRQKEREELEELKAKIFSEAFDNPVAEFEREKRRRDELYKPRVLIDVGMEQCRQREREAEKERERLRQEEALEAERQHAAMEAAAEALMMANSLQSNQIARPRTPPEPIHLDDDDDDNRDSYSPPPEDSSQSSINLNPPEERIAPMKPWISPQPVPPVSLAPGKKKKLDVREVFNNDDDDDSNLGAGKKRKLVPLDYGEDKKKKEDKKEDVAKSQEEKRRHIKSLIDKIPTEKTALFAFQLDWAAVDNQLMERRIRPWINKKIIEYIGEPEPTLVDFICSKVLAGSAPQGILDDVQMVLDDEAEVFVVKMWRLLIYEIEAKKMGLVK